MISPFINIPFGSIHLYQKPINMRLGEKKLLEICRSELNCEPRINELFLFFNSRRDTRSNSSVSTKLAARRYRSRCLAVHSCCPRPKPEKRS